MCDIRTEVLLCMFLSKGEVCDGRMVYVNSVFWIYFFRGGRMRMGWFVCLCLWWREWW